MDATWIVSANAGRARIFAQASAAAGLQEVQDLVNLAARQRDNEIDTDSLGQRAASDTRHGAGAGTPSSDYQPHQTPLQHEAERFARDLAKVLLQAHHERKFAKLCLVASPEFLGVLRRVLGRELEAVVTREINKDYTQLTAAELRERIRTLH